MANSYLAATLVPDSLRFKNAVLVVHHMSVERVLHPWRGIARPEQALRIGLVVGKQKLWSTTVDDIAREQIAPQRRMIGPQLAGAGAIDPALGPVAFSLSTPGPGVSVPQRREHVQGSGVRAAIGTGDLDQNIVRTCFGVLDEDIEVPALTEDPRVLDLELGIGPAAPPVLGRQLGVRKRALRILVESLQIRGGRRSL